MAAHDLENEYFRRGARHRGDVEPGLERGYRDVLRHRTETRTAVGMRQVVVHGLRYADTGDRVAHRLTELGHLQCGVHRIIAAVVEEIADIVSTEHFHEPLVLGAILVEALQLEACRAERARGGMREAVQRLP